MLLGFLILSISFVAISILVDKLLEDQIRTGLLKNRISSPSEYSGELLSERLRIYGTPDRVLLENGHLVPVERKSFAKKLHTRHIIQMAVYMALLEDISKKPVPYGYIVLGPKRKNKKIMNSDKLRRIVRLKSIELINILEGLNKPVADPYPAKCAKCVVRNFCEFKKF
ncbi:MAG: CRISPR-associated protein Cas4 [Deltaproteobacteria bacterium]|nr:CRISPR-associated protein Cas4 [Deltaproteobacteria bacterium]